jgi:hypothetical protein
VWRKEGSGGWVREGRDLRRGGRQHTIRVKIMRLPLPAWRCDFGLVCGLHSCALSLHPTFISLLGGPLLLGGVAPNPSFTPAASSWSCSPGGRVTIRESGSIRSAWGRHTTLAEGQVEPASSYIERLVNGIIFPEEGCCCTTLDVLLCSPLAQLRLSFRPPAELSAQTQHLSRGRGHVWLYGREQGWSPVQAIQEGINEC